MGRLPIDSALKGRGRPSWEGWVGQPILEREMSTRRELLVDEPYVVKTTKFLFSPRCFVGVVSLKHGDPNSVLVIDEYQKIWSVPKGAVERLEQPDWPDWAATFVAECVEADKRLRAKGL